MCCGLDTLAITSTLFHHVVPMSEGLEKDEQFPHKGYRRVKDCLVVCGKLEKVCSAYSELQKSSIEVLHELSNNFAKLFDSADNEIIRFMSLFWQLSPNLGALIEFFPNMIVFSLYMCQSLEGLRMIFYLLKNNVILV